MADVSIIPPNIAPAQRECSVGGSSEAWRIRACSNKPLYMKPACSTETSPPGHNARNNFVARNSWQSVPRCPYHALAPGSEAVMHITETSRKNRHKQDKGCTAAARCMRTCTPFARYWQKKRRLGTAVSISPKLNFHSLRGKEIYPIHAHSLTSTMCTGVECQQRMINYFHQLRRTRKVSQLGHEESSRGAPCVGAVSTTQ